MKKRLLQFILTVFTFLLLPYLNYGQAPNLGRASSFTLFTGAGAFSSTGATVIWGDIGNYVGAYSGSPTLHGKKHLLDSVAKQAATDVDSAYGYMSTLTCDTTIGTTIGGGMILTPRVYCTGAATTLNGTLTLDAKGNPNAIFIFKIDGAFTTATFSKIVLKNSASLCNVYWQVNGQFTLGDSSVFYGNVLTSGAISLLAGSDLFGRALSRAGAISLHANFVAIGMQSTATTNGNKTICSGNSVKLTVSASNGDSMFSYLWSPGGTTDSFLTVSPTVTTTYTVTVSATNSCAPVKSTFTVTVSSHVNITGSPTNQSICSGGSASFSVTATGTGLTYQWRKGTTNLSNGGNISGATSATLTINPAIATNAGNYNVIVGGAGTCSGTDTSASASLTISSGVVITTNPGNQSMCSGGSASFSVTATGTGLTYKWRKGTTNLSNSGNISGATTATLTINPATATNAGNYNVIVSATGACSGSDTSNNASLTINLATTGSQTTTACNTYTWNGAAYTTSGTYIDTFTAGNKKGCDSIATLYLTINNSTASSQTTSACNSYTWNGTTHTVSGIYTRTFTGGNKKGCDSIATLHLTINKSTTSAQTTIACNSYTWNGTSYTASGTYTRTYTAGSKKGCDSTATLNLTVNYSTAGSQTTTACNSYTWNGTAYTVSGTYIDTFTAGNMKGCDSTATLHLTVNNSTTGSQTTTACNGYTWNGTAYTASGTYSHTFTGGNKKGCDSTATLHLTINKSTTSSQTTTACNSYTWNGTAYTASGTYTRTFTGGNKKGCDSIATLHLTINNSTAGSQSATACISYIWNGTAYTVSGTYIDTFTAGNMKGCDSTATLHLTINNSTTGSQTTTACNSYTWNGTAYTTSGIYTHTFTAGNMKGCDSTATLYLTVNSSTTGTQTTTACNTYTWNGTAYTVSGTYTRTYTGGNKKGCDSTATLHLTINKSTTSSQTTTACNSYTWNGTAYAVSGTYTRTYTGGNKKGCDSTATLHLTINNSTTGSQTTTACNSYTWNGTAYTVSGIYSDTFTAGNKKGCDSTATLYLTINNSTIGSQTSTACNSYTWNGTAYTTSGTYTHTFTAGNLKGCDSTATLYLTINNSTIGSQTTAACNNYTWNGTAYSTSGTYTHTFTGGNKKGCDSTATLHLTINKSTTSSQTTKACNSYTWNGTVYTASGTYTRTYTGGNKKGCDSTATLYLTLNNSTIGSQTTTACNSYTWNGTVYSVSGTYIDTFKSGNKKGCDSIATLYLTVNSSTTGSQTNTACNSYTWNGTSYTFSGTYTHTYTGGNKAGCDSTATLYLTINKSSIGSQTTMACNSYTWNGTSYTASGTYTHTFTGGNKKGCDSTATLYLTVNASTTGSQTTKACNSYTWNGTAYTTSGTYTHTFTGGNKKGCDSTATLYLTVNSSTTSSQTTTACNSYTWNGTAYTTSGTYTRTYTGGNKAGCDSIATLYLTINTSSTGSQTTSACNSYTWNGTAYKATGTYTHTFTSGNKKGCDSVATLYLTINTSTTGSQTTTACDSYTWNGTAYAVSGTYTHTFTGGNKKGCDSIATLYLTLNTSPHITGGPNDQSVCDGSSESFWVTATGTNLTYQWRKGTTNLKNGGRISGATSAILTINPVSVSDTATDYNVIVHGTCGNDTSHFVFLSVCGTGTGVAPPIIINKVNNAVSIFPNPFNSSLNIKINNAMLMEVCEVRIYNTLGSEVLRKTITKEVSTLETSNLASGLYVYKVFSDDKVIQTGKLISQ